MTGLSNPNTANNLKIQHDGPLTIAIGKSRKETDWKNKEMSWAELLKRLSQTYRTRETYEEYRKMPKTQQDEIKDVGGFVGGTLKGGRRKTEAVVWRQVLTLDADYVKGDFWAAVETMLDCTCLVYSTHKHSPDSPRLRLVIPLSRPVTPDEYQAVSRRVAADLGIDFFDDTTYQPHRLMYWPSTASDGEYVFRYMDAPWLNPDEVLARYSDWQDQSYWPESSRAQKIRQRLADKQGDPHEKSGIVGAFCRTYSVSEALETFLSEVYEPCAMEGRYTYIPGTSTGGLILYDNDKFAFSHHGTDPIGGRLVNAFDLVRLHKFGIQDDDAEPGTPTIKLPSYKSMVEFAGQDDSVKMTLGTERLTEAGEEFSTPIDEETKPNYDWLKKLEYSKKGEIEDSLKNLVTILRNDPNLQGIAYDAHKGNVVLLKAAPWRKPEEWRGPVWSDDDDSSLRVYLEKVFHTYSPPKLNDALSAVSHERSFHPIRDYLNGLPVWDGIDRLDAMLIDYLQAEDTPYIRAITRKTMAAAVARVMNPGCKFDYMLVLVGKQGVGKSTLFKRLGGRWFNDSLSMNDTKDKTAAEKLQGYWIMEIGELAGIKKAEVEAVKSFLSRQHDIYRPAFGRRTIEHPRQCIIVGSTNNDSGFLRDSTGNRRFWPVTVEGAPVGRGPWAIDDYTVDMLWAEAFDAWKQGEELYLTGELEDAAREQQRLAMESDDRVGMLREYLNTPLPGDWEEMDLNNRRMYLSGSDFGETAKGTVRRDKVCVAAIWCEMYGHNLANIKRTDIDEIHGLMRQIDGWAKYTGSKDGKMWFRLYGSQRAYVRI